MPLDPVEEIQASIVRLAGSVRRLQDTHGETLGVRRLTSDVERLAADLDELGGPAPGHHPPIAPDQREVISDEPYDDSMWGDADSESTRAF